MQYKTLHLENWKIGLCFLRIYPLVIPRLRKYTQNFHLSICLFVLLSLCLSLCLSVCLFVSLSVCFHVRLSVFLYVCPSVHLKSLFRFCIVLFFRVNWTSIKLTLSVYLSSPTISLCFATYGCCHPCVWGLQMFQSCNMY